MKNAMVDIILQGKEATHYFYVAIKNSLHKGWERVPQERFTSEELFTWTKALNRFGKALQLQMFALGDLYLFPNLLMWDSVLHENWRNYNTIH